MLKAHITKRQNFSIMNRPMTSSANSRWTSSFLRWFSELSKFWKMARYFRRHERPGSVKHAPPPSASQLCFRNILFKCRLSHFSMLSFSVLLNDNGTVRDCYRHFLLSFFENSTWSWANGELCWIPGKCFPRISAWTSYEESPQWRDAGRIFTFPPPCAPTLTCKAFWRPLCNGVFDTYKALNQFSVELASKAADV